MANVASIRNPQTVRFSVDTPANAATFNLTMSRAVEVSSISLVRTDAVGGGTITFRNGAATISIVNNPANLFDTATAANLNNVSVVSGANLSIQTSSNTVFFRAYVTILPGI
jgi:hypothetical protein